MLNNPFKNDPFAMVWTAFKNLYPDKDCDIWYDLRSNIGVEEGYGFTEFPKDGGKPQIVIFMETEPCNQIEILAHELAHVAVGGGENDEHGDAWERAFDDIFKEYRRIGDEMFGPTSYMGE